MSQHILFVDDEAPTRELLSMFFRKKGFLVATARTAAEGQELLDNQAFDLAVLDLNLAGQNGMELLTHSKQNRPALPVVLFTGLALEPNLLAEAQAKGADATMRKTQPLNELLEVVQRLLNKPVKPPGN